MARSRIARPKRSAQKGAATKALAVLVEDSGETLDMPCSNCFRHNRTCVVDLSKSNSCSECVRRKTACDGQDITRRLYKSMKESKRLEAEEDKLVRSSVEIQSRLLRVREQRRHLQKRQKEMFDRGMADLAEELGDNDPLVSEESTTSEPGVALPEVGFDEWAQEQGLDLPEILSPDPLSPEVAGVGQETAGESSRSRPSG
ncbi:hypothetical protein B0H65DRAFT_485592 [Neurospora tetraspora]|uniref:Zn(2)-C6 fungal-type domain-containing protein n=1 Tax=Neurospora tetraspora TaxID=94610 RepID=A0AAE0JPZ8_9PEZI|nr:hypothetical protein B0H65DRAFT_485592 [Neurospora tetraspora]